MIPTGQNICDLVRSIVGDTQVAGGQIFKNPYLYGADQGSSPPFTGKGGPMQSAYNWLFERMRTQNDRRSRRTSFGLINSNINYINPITIGIGNMGNPIDIWERGTVTSLPITAVTVQPASTGVDPYVQLAVAHGGSLVNGQVIETYLIQGLSDDVNDYWTITVPDSTHIRLMGATPAGTWTSNTGLVLISTEQWPGQPMNRSWNLFQERTANQGSSSANSPANMFVNWQWQTGIIRVPPVTAPREIMINYNLSGQIPLDPTLSLGIDDALNVMSYRVSAIVGRSKGKSSDLVQGWMDDSDKFMAEFLRPVTKDLQRERLVVPPYRPRRNTGYFNPY